VDRAASTIVKSYAGSVRARADRKKSAFRPSMSYAVIRGRAAACDSRVVAELLAQASRSRPASSYFSSVSPPAEAIVLPRLRLKIVGPSIT
jgi:hypothetical protein